MLALILGAGFSKWAAGLPTARGLFDFKVLPWGPREARKLALVRSLKQAWDRLHPRGIAEEFIADTPQFSDEDRDAVRWYVARRLSQPFIWKEFHEGRWRREVINVNDPRKFKIYGVKKARKFLHELSDFGLAGIISANYDPLAEYAVGASALSQALPACVGDNTPHAAHQMPLLESGIPLAKIHGSLLWDMTGMPSDGGGMITGDVFLSAPGFSGTQPETMAEIYETAERILRNASKIVVFGFSFNAYDAAAIELARRAKPAKVLVIDPSKFVAAATRKIWPDAEVKRCLPTKIDKELRKWLKPQSKNLQSLK
jgi:hypothetical protein